MVSGIMGIMIMEHQSEVIDCMDPQRGLGERPRACCQRQERFKDLGNRRLLWHGAFAGTMERCHPFRIVLLFGSFQNQGAPDVGPKCGALVMKTPTTEGPQFMITSICWYILQGAGG